MDNVGNIAVICKTYFLGDALNKIYEVIITRLLKHLDAKLVHSGKLRIILKTEANGQMFF